MLVFLPFFSIETWTLLAILIGIFIKYGYSSYGVFKKLGIPGPKPTMYLGTVTQHGRIYYFQDLECAKIYGKVWGSYEFKKPVLAVTDPGMVKTILVKECFSNFTNRRNLRLYGDIYDAVSFAEDDQWRRIRNILSPCFTSGHIKEMFHIMKHHSHKLMESLRTKVQNDDVVTLNDYFGSYILDAMASIAFSLDTDTLANPSDAFTTNANQLFRINILLFTIQGVFPFLLPLFEMLDFSLFPRSATTYFQSVLTKIRAEHRNSSSKNRVDFLQLMIDSKGTKSNKGNNLSKAHMHTNTSKHVLMSDFLSPTGLSKHEIYSQATTFISGGYVTSSTTLNFMAYSLATNPHVMYRLQEEIESTFPNKAPIQYEGLVQMEYLDCVVNETLRLFPPSARLERVAKKTVEVKGIVIPKGMVVMIPLFALHRDADFWPEPEEFRPDRFSKENKHNIEPYTYLPFGAGPRNCIGMRFVLVMMKLVLVEVLQNYSFSVCKETEIPLEFDGTGLVGPVRPIKLKLVPRSISSQNGDNATK
ncbi:cytochrome P450 3A40-like isoform X2 [Lampris incognitus]|uniref:cytochrome P450 3A40-like isoform X2 n=1 Tax=Lampris incognitus TaxID=2546036 RepID=UPI0024B561B5|nr:cytochrome P450 3A40-like isoform X2 [Lampris incognitus]